MTAVFYNGLARMRIGVDAHAVGRKLTGNETYIRNLLREYVRAGRCQDLVCYLSAAPNLAPAVSGLLDLGLDSRFVSANPFVRLGLDLSQRSRLDRLDLLHVQYTAPLACPVPIVATIHDVSYLEVRQFFSFARAAQLRITVGRTVRRAARIIAPSEFSRRRISKAYNIDDNLISVIHNGVDPQFRVIPRETAAARIRMNHGIEAPYILSVGDLHPRKNQTGLIRAFSNIVKTDKRLPHHLVLVGKEGWHGREVREQAQSLGVMDRVHFPGFVPDADLVDFYAGCDLFVFPSFYEGFGLPVLEAMACGRAVACSQTTALPEVSDSAALLFDPADDQQIAKAMIDFLLSNDLRLRYERMGHQWASKFSWQRAAAETMAVYERVVEDNKGAVLESAGRRS